MCRWGSTSAPGTGTRNHAATTIREQREEREQRDSSGKGGAGGAEDGGGDEGTEADARRWKPTRQAQARVVPLRERDGRSGGDDISWA